MVDIKDISGKVLYSTPINEGSKRKYTLMKEDYISLKFSLDNPIYFKLGDGIDNEIGLFELIDLYKPTFNDRTGAYDYDLRLDAYYMKWKNKKFFYTPEDGAREASWSLTANLETHVNVLIKNLTALGYTYRGLVFEPRINATVINEARFIDYQNVNLIDALTRMAEVFECEWWVEGCIIKFGRCENANPPIDFTFDGNVAKMSRKDSQSTFATRIYAFGSERNIPRSYRRVLDFTATVDGRFIYDADKPLEERFFPIESKVVPIYTPSFDSDYKVEFSYDGIRPSMYPLAYVANSIPKELCTLDLSDLNLRFAVKLDASGSKTPIKVNVDLFLRVYYNDPLWEDVDYKLLSVKDFSVVAVGDGWSSLDQLEDSFALDCLANVTYVKMLLSVTNSDGTDLTRHLNVASSLCYVKRLDGVLHYNVPITAFGVKHECMFYPSLESKRNVLLLPEGATVSNGDRYTIDNIIKSRVPGSYFTASSSELTAQGVVTKRLMLPADTPYIDAFPNMNTEDIVEEIVIFDDVYPQREGVMSEVEPKKVFDQENGVNLDTFHYEYIFKDTGLKNFSASYKLEGKDLEITFSTESKHLIGRKFVVELVSSNDTGTVFKVKPIEEGGRFIPDETLCPVNGDKYVLAGYDVDLVSTTLIPEAEAKLKERALEYIEKLKIDPSVYECVLKSTYAYDGGKGRFFEAGERVNLINPAYFENGRQSRIIGYELNLDIPYDSPIYIVGESAPYSRVAALESKVDSLTYQGKTFFSSYNPEEVIIIKKTLGEVKAKLDEFMGFTYIGVIEFQPEGGGVSIGVKTTCENWEVK